MLNRPLFTYLALSILLSQTVFAGNDHHHHDHEHKHDHDHSHNHAHEDDFIEHSSHVHGEANANIVFSKEELSINLTLPALNAFGFEHQPKNEAEEQKTQQTLEKLGKPTSVLNLNEQCEVESANVSSESDQEHYDVEVSYQYHCHDVEEIELSFIFFDQLHELEKIAVQYLSDHSQNLLTITPAQPTIHLH